MTDDDLNQIRTLLCEELRAALAESEMRSQEFSLNIETNLLTAFHGHAKGQTARLHTAEVAASDLAIRMAALEERVLHLETRRPPQP